MTESTHYVPICALHDLSKKIAKLAKKAKKIGCMPVTMVEGEPVTLHEVAGFDGMSWKLEVGDAETATGRVVEAVTVTVSGETPKYNGWTFLATLEPLGDENIVRSIDDAGDLSEYRSRIGECDHCKKIRKRTNTYVVRHDDGTTKMVGKSCLKDFLGHSNPNILASYAEMIFDIGETVLGEYCDDEGYGGRAVNTVELGRYLDATSGHIRAYGWVSRTAAKDGFGKVATADCVWNHITTADRDRGKEWNEVAEKIECGEREKKRAIEAIKWCTDNDGADNDYLRNLHLIAKAGYTTHRLAGYAASMIVAYNNHLNRETERAAYAARPDSHHIGELKKRMELVVTCHKIIEIQNDWGVTGIHKLTDADGNDVTWFASGSTEWLDEGETVTVKATPTKHDEYKGRPCTVVNRVAIQNA